MFELAVILIGGYIGLHLLFIIGVAIGNVKMAIEDGKVETVKAFWDLPLYEQLKEINKLSQVKD